MLNEYKIFCIASSSFNFFFFFFVDKYKLILLLFCFFINHLLYVIIATIDSDNVWDETNPFFSRAKIKFLSNIFIIINDRKNRKNKGSEANIHIIIGFVMMYYMCIIIIPKSYVLPTFKINIFFPCFLRKKLIQKEKKNITFETKQASHHHHQKTRNQEKK